MPRRQRFPRRKAQLFRCNRRRNSQVQCRFFVNGNRQLRQDFFTQDRSANRAFLYPLAVCIGGRLRNDYPIAGGMAGCRDNLLLLDNRIAYRAVSTFGQTRCGAGGFDGDIFDLGVTLGLNDRRSADSFAALRANLVFHAVHRAARRYGHGLRSVLMHIVIAVTEFK